QRNTVPRFVSAESSRRVSRYSPPLFPVRHRSPVNMATADHFKECMDFRDDYEECLHHRKEDHPAFRVRMAGHDDAAHADFCLWYSFNTHASKAPLPAPPATLKTLGRNCHEFSPSRHASTAGGTLKSMTEASGAE
ncbi:hypothetical protein NGA_0524900, partial [Nannochloropsis gaditana CCMP526]|uniref:uncharacterized protein n=1 Tax=Nannochloropsis gaditana (strain CCMP526) TaxID=1093141 RepID=UPI00029F5402